MRVEALDVRKLFEFDPAGGIIRFAGNRTLAIDANAMGILRKDLVTRFGLAAARSLLTRFGFAQGWELAEAMAARFAGASPEECCRAGCFLPMLEGLYRLEPGSGCPLSRDGATLRDSFEAEQQLAHLGPGGGPACWTACGLASGYLSRTLGQDLVVLEEQCTALGDPHCRLLGRAREGWGEDRAGDLCFFPCGLPLASPAPVPAEEPAPRTLALAPLDPEPLGMVARSPAMRNLLDLARRIAKVNSTLLITGESGTGKERVARLVHDLSLRGNGPFIAVNCGAITETLLESELFGHARGAFTGAAGERTGLFEAANGGTLLLDEVGEISPAMQVKLLRVLQEREVRRVGESVSRPIDVRVIAATNRELARELAEGRFRKDLYYRLNVVELHVPALRERREDILPLARVLLTQAAERLNRPVPGISPLAVEQLLRYPWPGNVRELENAMERAVALARANQTDLEDLPEEVRQEPPGPALRPVQALEEVERDHILAVLGRNGGNQARTAEQLGIGSATLYRKLKSYGATRDRRPAQIPKQVQTLAR